MKQKLKSHLLLLISILLLINCQKDESMWFNGQYVLLEKSNYDYNEVIEGEYYSHLEWDGFGYYQFDPSEGTLTGTMYEEDMNENTLMILAYKDGSGGDIEGGYGSGLREIHELPTKVYDLTVTRIDEDGTVYLTYKDTSLVLTPDEEWSKTWTELKTKTSEFTDWNEFGELITRRDTLLVQYTYYFRVKNSGLLEKSKFEKIEW